METLKWLREEHEESQKYLSEYLQVAQSTLSKWESGEYEPNIDMLKRLANHYKVSIDYLVGYTNKKPQHNTVSDLLAEYLTRTYKRAYSEYEIKSVRDMIDILEKYGRAKNESK